MGWWTAKTGPLMLDLDGSIERGCDSRSTGVTAAGRGAGLRGEASGDH